MSDQEYREIQLTGKQIVFLFMSVVVLAVVIFLLGVSVGRGVRGPAPERADGMASGDTVATVGTPPPTQAAPGNLSYHSMLQGQPGARGAAPPPASGTPPNPPAQSDPVPTDPKPTPPPVDPAPPGRTGAPPAVTAPPRETAPRPSEPPPAPPKSEGWMVQVGAFRSRDNADRLAAQLKRRGHAASVRQMGVQSAPYHVRVGPFAGKAEADKAAAALAKEEGVGRPSVIR